MSKRVFTDQEIIELSKSRYIKHISDKSITYSDEFRSKFYFEYNNGKPAKEIFVECGIDPKIIGDKRIHSFACRIYKEGNDGHDFKDRRTQFSGRQAEELNEFERNIRKNRNRQLSIQEEALRKLSL